MDDIKISDIEFLLEDIIYDLNESSFGSFDLFGLFGLLTDNYINYIYLAFVFVFVTLLVVIFLIYKFYVNREKKVTFQDKIDEYYGDVWPR
jgi:hypothetical protein